MWLYGLLYSDLFPENRTNLMIFHRPKFSPNHFVLSRAPWRLRINVRL